VENRGCGCFGNIFTLLAVYGGFQLYQNFSAPSGCDGWEDWARTSESRFNDALAGLESLSPFSSSTSRVLRAADDLREDASTQRTSEPPDDARELSDAAATFYSMIANSYEALALGERPPYTEQELLDQANLVTQFLDEVNESCGG